MKEADVDSVAEKKSAPKAEAVRHETVVQAAPQRQLPRWTPWAVAGAVTLLIGLMSYGVGYQFGKRATATRGTTTYGPMMQGSFDQRPDGGTNNTDGSTSTQRNRRSMMGGTYGKVTAVSGSSITVTDSMRGGSVTYTINSDTKVTDVSGNTKAVSDITSGSSVRISATGSDRTIATTIQIN